MQLTEQAIEKIKASATVKKELVYHLSNTASTLYRWLDANVPNGPLTTIRSIELIKEHTGLSQEQILSN